MAMYDTLDDNADLYVIRIWYEVDPGHDVAAPEAGQEIITVKAISPQQAMEYAKMQWDGPIDRIEIVDINPEDYVEEEPFYASTAINATGRSYSSKKTVEDNKRARMYTYSVYLDYGQDRLDALLAINWNDVTARDSESFLIDLVNFPDLSAITSVRYVTDDELNQLYSKGYDGGFSVMYVDGDEEIVAWKDNDNNLYPIHQIEGCDRIMSAKEITEETSFKEWLASCYGEDFDPSGLSDEEFFDLEDQYRADVPKQFRERNYR